VNEAQPGLVAARRAGESAQNVPVARSRWPRRLLYVLLIGYAILMFTPFAWSVITSFKTQADAVNLSVIPQPITTEGWDYLLQRLDPSLLRLFANSFGIALAVTLSNLVLASLAGYAFARLRFPGRKDYNE